MRPFKAIIALVLVAATAAGSATAAPGDAFDPLAIPALGNTHVMYVVEDGVIQNGSFIAIQPTAVSKIGETREDWLWCESLKDTVCDPKKNPKNISGLSVYGPCESALQDNCVESLSMGKDPQNLIPAKLIRKTNSITFDPVPEYNYPGSSSISLWDVPGPPNASGTTTYAITATSHLWFSREAFITTDFYAAVTPYREQTGNYRQTKIDPDPLAPPVRKYQWGSEQFCVFAEDGLCGIAQDFAPETYIELKVRIPKDVGGWFRGRIQEPTLDVASFSAKSNLITIKAAPATVSRFAIPLTQANFTAQEKLWYENMGRWGNDLITGTGPQAGVPKDSFPVIEYYRERLKDTAVGSNTFWNVTTTSYGNGSSCLQDKTKILGVVTTNATAYDGSSPAFENGSLNYNVSGLHYAPDGKTEVIGTYSLVMRSDVARCLYGFTSAPIQATVSIAGASGSVVATTVVNESKGWLRLSAGGFTFSEKTIKVALSQAAAAAVVTPPVVVAPIIKKKTTITCVKGKATKKVTAVSPKCPAGYKKK